MPAKPHSVRIQEYELHDLFDALELFERAADGRLTQKLEDKTMRPSYRCSLGGQSYFMRFYDDDDRTVARVHYLRCVFGHLIGVYPSMVRIGDVVLYRDGHQRRPEGW